MSTRHLSETQSRSATPLARQHDSHVAVQDLSQHLDQLSATLQSSASAQQRNIVQLRPTNIDEAIQQLGATVGRRRQKERDTLDNTKKWVREDLRNEILSRLRDDLRKEMEEEIAKTVKEQVDAQIVNHIPIPLKKQLVDCQAQLKQVEVSLTNSKARGIHAYYELSPDSLNEPLKPFVDASGRKSDVYPADLSSLFTYDAKDLKKLVSDYGLVPDNDQLSNINRFMDHIGIKHRLEQINIGKH